MACIIPELPPLRGGKREQAWSHYLESRAKGGTRSGAKLTSSSTTPALSSPEEFLRPLPRPSAQPFAQPLRTAKGSRCLSAPRPSVRTSNYFRPTSAGGWFGDVGIHSVARDRYSSPDPSDTSTKWIQASGRLAWQSAHGSCATDRSLSELTATELSQAKETRISKDPRITGQSKATIASEASFPKVKRQTRASKIGISRTGGSILELRRQGSGGSTEKEAEDDSLPSDAKLPAQRTMGSSSLNTTRRFSDSDKDPESASSGSSSGSEDAPSSQSSTPSCSFRRQPIEVDLPIWYPEIVPMHFVREASRDSQDPNEFMPESPLVSCDGPGKIVVRWKLPPQSQLDMTWSIRLRQSDGDGTWLVVDLDSGRVIHEAKSKWDVVCQGLNSDLVSWKHRAVVMQPGLRVLGYAVQEGEKSAHPFFGTVVANYPGITVVDFDPLLSIHGDVEAEDTLRHSWRQTIPQDWIVLAATTKAIGKSMSEFLEQQAAQSSIRKRATGLWCAARTKIYESLVISHRHCTIIWNYWTPEIDAVASRLAVSCAMKVRQTGKNREDGSLPLAGGRNGRSEEPENNSKDEFGRQQSVLDCQNSRRCYTWWPVVIDSEMGVAFSSRTVEVPKELSCSTNIGIILEPWPRIQMIPKKWVCTQVPEAERAYQNLCIGQCVLAFYNRTVTGAETLPLHPPPQITGDVTLRKEQHEDDMEPDEGEFRSERAVCCTLRREFASPAQVFARVHSPSMRKIFHVPLTAIQKVQYGTKRQAIHDWVITRDQSNGSFTVLAQIEPEETLENAKKIEFEVGAKITFYRIETSGKRAGKRKLSTGLVEKLTPRITHYEVIFEDSIIRQREKVSAHSLCSSIEADCHRRLQQPEIFVHDMPAFLHNIEVSVGVSHSPDGQKMVWSAPSNPCKVTFQKTAFSVPLGPSVAPCGISRAAATWLLPPQPVAKCYRMRFRRAGEKEWSFVDTNGRSRDPEHTFAWRWRLVPLVKGLWASAFGDYDGRKASTPGAAKVIELGVNTEGQRNSTVKVLFQEPSTELCVGAEESAPLICTQSPQDMAKRQTIPYEWIEAVWLHDNHNYLKGSILRNYNPTHTVHFIPNPAETGTFNVKFAEEDEELLPLMQVRSEYLFDAGVSNIAGDVSTIPATMQAASLHLHGLQPEVQYEIGVQALTSEGWTDWSHVCFQMPSTALKQEKNVSEKAKGVFYKSALLPQAFFKEYQKCWITLEEQLPADRFERLQKATMAYKSGYDAFDLKLSRWLVDMEGPIRSKLPIDEIRVILQDVAGRRADLNYRDQSTGRTPLTYACEYEKYVKPGVVEELLDLRADPDAMNDLRQTALALAADRGNSRIVKTLLEHGADVNLMNFSGGTAYLVAVPQVWMAPFEIAEHERVREFIAKDRVDWDVFVERVKAAGNPVAIAKVFSELAFPGNAEVFEQDSDGGKRISRHDRLRLREQIAEAEEFSSAEAWQRAIFCGRELLLPQMEMAALQTEPNKVCAPFTRYLLMSGVMRFVKDEAHDMATRILHHFEGKLTQLRENLSVLPSLTTEGEMFVGFAAKKNRQRYLNRVLHQWHAHGDLPWLTQRNVVGLFEALVHAGSVQDLSDFCNWIGELSARIHATDPGEREYVGAWDQRLAPLVWGDAYTKFLQGEAGRSAPVFHEIARTLVRNVGGSVTYTEVANKNYSRVSKKQIEYASFGMLVLHVALDHMQCFQQAFRADIEAEPLVIKRIKHVNTLKGAVLILGSLQPNNFLLTQTAITNVKHRFDLEGTDGNSPMEKVHARQLPVDYSSQEPPILVVVAPDFACTADFDETRRTLEQCGADAVVLMDGPLEVPNVRAKLEKGLAEAYVKANLPEPDIETTKSADQLQLLLEIRKCRTKYKPDLLCSGGVLDLVRGSIVCETEEEVKKVYDAALSLSVQRNSAEVVRVKNGFHTPAVGGYCDLKLFLQVAKDRSHDSREFCHICELQVHLKTFLEKKKYTHMPYVIDRGDFDYN